MGLVTADRTYKFEIAFSFLQEDETLAYEINDLIQDRLSSFIYSEQQKEAVGKDGIETYTKIFLDEARIVVILYRENWGTTPFTRIEENAIKQRSSEESLDFTVFISLDKNKPKWVSKFQIWYDFDRYGIKPAAAIIEKRVSEYGGQIREETIADQAARHKREIIRQKKLDDYVLSRQALNDGLNEIKKLLQIAENNIDATSDDQVGLHFDKEKKDGEYFSSFAQNIGLTFHWKQRYNDSLVGSYLKVYIADGDFYDRSPNNQGEVFKNEEYVFYLNEADSIGWVRKKDKKEFITTVQLITLWQKNFLERVRQERLKNSNERSRY